MVKAGVIILVVGVLVLVGGGLMAWRAAPKSQEQLEQILQTYDLQPGQTTRVQAQLSTGQTGYAMVAANVSDDDRDQARSALKPTVRVYDDQGQLLAENASAGAINLSIQERPVLVSTEFPVPASGNLAVEVTLGALPEGSAITPVLYVAGEGWKGMAAKIGGGFGMACCVGPVLLVLGVVLLIVGLVRGRRRGGPPDTMPM